MAKKKDFKSTKVKKKLWVDVIAPKAFKEQPLGQTHVDEKENAVGKSITVNLMTLVGDPKKQGISATFKIASLAGDKAQTSFTGWKMLPSSLKRIIRRNRTRIDSSFVCQTEDGQDVRVKPMCITRGRANSSVVQTLRRHMVDVVRKQIAATKLEAIAMDLVARRFQNEMRNKLQKFHPLSACEVRVLHTTVVKKR